MLALHLSGGLRQPGAEGAQSSQCDTSSSIWKNQLGSIQVDSALVAHSDDNIDAVGARARRCIGQLVNHHVAGRDIQ